MTNSVKEIGFSINIIQSPPEICNALLMDSSMIVPRMSAKINGAAGNPYNLIPKPIKPKINNNIKSNVLKLNP